MKIDYHRKRRHVRRRCHHHENFLLIPIFTLLNFKFHHHHQHDSIFHCHYRHRHSIRFLLLSSLVLFLFGFYTGLIETYEFFHHDHHHYEKQYQPNQQQIHFGPITANRSNQSNIFRIDFNVKIRTKFSFI
ncbi:hypothetical protein BLA29_005236 [Euroglyphus maynei]|uniref:Uncharacterized protein n=1 Tax=Euroglyphus maynei TaxID=6958 RepID=A0A1Y3AWG5_EURMA|nr:hypothetical protein BLA29_005236 [Euroglyphus maynei]